MQTHAPRRTKPAAPVEPTVAEHALVDDADDWLDEIDDVLEANDAELFLRNYVQKGGE